MSNKIASVVWILLCSIQWAAGQSVVLEGQIRNAKDEAAVPMANVIIESQDGGWLGYTTADAMGKYRVSWTSATDTVWVVVHALGYAKAKLAYVLPKATESPFLLDIALRESSYDLNEVVVREDPLPVIRHSDTTTFQVAAFADSTESSVEELLKKLPGMEVDENGLIKYNGKAISKVLIESDDMFGMNYTLGTRNIRATAIEKVQVIDKYLDNALLKDVVYSDDMVLNLTISKAQKRILSGTVSLSAGYGDEVKANESLNAFSFTKQSKALLFGNWNNTGLNSIGEVNAIGNDPLSTSLDLDRQAKSAGALLSLPSITTLGLRSQFVNNARRGLGHLSNVVKLNDALKIKYMATYYDTRNAQRSTANNLFFNITDTLALTETTDYQGRYRFGALGVTLDYRPTERPISHKVVARYHLPQQVATLDIRRVQGTQRDTLPLGYRERPLEGFLGWEYTRRFANRVVVQTVLDYAYTRNDQQLDTRFRAYRDVLGFDADSLHQTIRLPQHEARGLVRYLKGTSRYLLRLELGARASMHQLDTRSQMLASSERSGQDTLWLRGSFQDHRISPFVRLDYTLHLSHKTKLNGGFYAEQAIGQYESTTLQATPQVERYNTPLYSPFISLRHRVGDWQWSLRYAFTSKLPSLEQRYPSAYFTDHQSLSQGLLTYAPIQGHSLNGGIRYFNSLTLSNAYLYLGYNHNPDNLGTRFSFQEGFFQSGLWRPVPQSFASVSAQAEHLFSALLTRFKVNYNLMHTIGQNEVNTLQQEEAITMHTIRLEAGTAFSTWVNAGLRFQLQTQQTSTTSEAGTLTLPNRMAKPEITLSVRPNRQLTLTFNGYGIYSRNADRSPNFIYATNFYLWYNFQGRLKGHSIDFRIINLLDQPTYGMSGLTVFNQYENSIQAIPRFFTFSWTLPLQ